jgi:hypothetical protein
MPGGYEPRNWAWGDGALWILRPGALSKVDPASGRMETVAHPGEHFYASGLEVRGGSAFYAHLDEYDVDLFRLRTGG